MEKEYNKLIRDNIPSIIENSGKRCVIDILTDEKYIAALDKKLEEELAEYLSEPCLEELADLTEVIYAIAVARGYGVEELEEVRKEKAIKRGGFEKKIFLKSVYED